MNKLFKIIAIFPLYAIFHMLFTDTAAAVCPVCTVAVSAGLGLSRYFGIDDSVTGVWVGGLILSSSFWLIDWLNKKKYVIRNTKYEILITISMYFLVLLPLWFTDVVGHPLNTILGIDKLLVGTFLGSVGFLLGVYLDKKQRKIKGRQFFVYQKVAFPVICLIILSIAFYLLTKYGI